MRRFLLPLLSIAAGCAAECVRPPAGGAPPAPAAPARLPATLSRLVLNEGHPSALPVEFDHGSHAGRGGEGSCVSCHHELVARPAAVPSACSSCHIPFYLAPEVDESLPHRHDAPPDL